MNKIYLSDMWRNSSLERVSKRTARRHYNNGESIIILPVKCYTEMFAFETKENYNKVKDFDQLVNEFEYYNCNHECGYYAAFYVVNGKMIEPIEKGCKND